MSLMRITPDARRKNELQGLRLFLELNAVGRENRWTRQRLAEQFGWDDRKLRRYIEELQKLGMMVVPDYGVTADAHGKIGGGYFIATDCGPLWEAHNQHKSRLISHATSMKALRGALAELPPLGQQVLDLMELDEASAPAVPVAPSADCSEGPQETDPREERDEAGLIGNQSGNPDDRPGV